MTDKNYGVILVTTGSQAEAKKIAQALIEAKLAACVSMTAIHSVYRWQGEIQAEDEWQLIIKTELSKFKLLEVKVRELHSYEVPEIIVLPILAGESAYLQWISESVKE